MTDIDQVPVGHEIDKRALIAQKTLSWIRLLGTPKEVTVLIGELLDCLPDNHKWQGDETWRWCWEELSHDAQNRVASVRRKAVVLLSEIEKAQEGG